MVRFEKGDVVVHKVHGTGEVKAFTFFGHIVEFDNGHQTVVDPKDLTHFDINELIG